MQINRHSFIIILGLLIFTVSFPAINALAQQPQEASLSIEPGNIYIRFTPENFALAPIFMDPLSPTATPVYTTYPSLLTEEMLTPDQQSGSTLPGQFVMEDALGNAFEAQIQLSNLVDGDKVIPFTALSFVTLANDPLGIDPFNLNSSSAAIARITAPIACLGWNNNIQTNCTTQFDTNNLIAEPKLHPADPVIEITDVNETYIYVDPAIPYSDNAIIELSGGEKALILEKAADNSWLRVKRGVLGTTAVPHPAGSGITCNGHSAAPVTIINGAHNPDRIGSYTVGFGLRLMVEPYFEPGNYSGLITITLQS